MNPNDMFADLPTDEREELANLVETAVSLSPDDNFIRKTEMQLKDAFAAKREKTMKRFNLLWQILAGTAAIAALALATIWLVRSVAPEPHNPSAPGDNITATATLPESTPRPESTPTPETVPTPTIVAELPTYDWLGTTVYRAVDFPKAPAEAFLRTYSADPPATLEFARQLAERFGIKGEVYLSTKILTGSDGFLAPDGFLVTDGKQRLYVSSERSFSYRVGTGVLPEGEPVSLEIASGPIDSFLKARGFDFAYRLEAVGSSLPDSFQVIPLTHDGLPINFSGSREGLRVQVDTQGQVINLDTYLLNVDAQPVGQFGILSAEEAWQKFLQVNSLGDVESQSSGPGFGRLYWQRVYPDNQPMTLYGSVTSFSSAEAGKPPFISIDTYTAIGKTGGMEKLASYAFVQAEGQFINENGIQKFQVDSWQTFEAGTQTLEGDLRSEGGKTIFSSKGIDYLVSDLPVEVPVPAKNIDITGMVNGTNFDWQSIVYFNSDFQGGGGGGGGNFAKLNLSGTPVPWPSPQPVATPESLLGKRVESQQGNVNVTIYKKADGSQRTEYTFWGAGGIYILQGQGLDQLQAYQNRPLIVWGTVTGYSQHDNFQAPILSVERYQDPFPGLKFQILRGKQKNVKLDGQLAALFTTEAGKTYVQLANDGSAPDGSLIGNEADLVLAEVLLIPGETFAGYPAMRFFGGGLAANLTNGQTLEITADKPYVQAETGQGTGPLTLTIESIELVYYADDPRNAGSDPQTVSAYLQPAWRFYGHYNNGTALEILIQALKQDYLFPEAAPVVIGG